MNARPIRHHASARREEDWTATPLFDPDRHESLDAPAWDEHAARRAIERIGADACRDFGADGLWPAHARDIADVRPSAQRDAAARPLQLHRVGAIAAPPDFGAARADLLQANRRAIRRFTPTTGSLLMGDAGILLLEWQHSRSESAAEELARSIADNLSHPTRELMWGASGSLVAALAMHGWTGETRWAELFRAGAAMLWQQLEYDPECDCQLWTQDLYGERSRLLGAVHGFAGNVLPVVRGRALLPPEAWERWQRCIEQTITRTALRADRLANWPPSVGAARVGRTALLVQQCHGAPGVVSCLAGLPTGPLDALLAEAGELTWRAGPLAKGVSLCHGTAGNGYAFLALFQRSKDPRWLERARAFAMHAIGQLDRHRRASIPPHHSLWTGETGLALYLWSCIRADARFPTLERF